MLLHTEMCLCAVIQYLSLTIKDVVLQKQDFSIAYTEISPGICNQQFLAVLLCVHVFYNLVNAKNTRTSLLHKMTACPIGFSKESWLFKRISLMLFLTLTSSDDHTTHTLLVSRKLEGFLLLLKMTARLISCSGGHGKCLLDVQKLHKIFGEEGCLLFFWGRERRWVLQGRVCPLERHLIPPRKRWIEIPLSTS